MRVLLVATNRWTAPYPVYPLGLDYVCGAIGERHQVCRVDLCGEPDNRRVLEAIVSFVPEVVGLSVRNIDNTDFDDARGFVGELGTLVREIRCASSAPIVLGGSGYSLFPAELLAAVGANFGIVGEGERFPEFLDALVAGLPAGAQNGVVEPGKSVAVPPPWTGRVKRSLPAGDEAMLLYLQRGGMMGLQTQRGCGFSCSYCTYPLLEGHQLRRFEPAEVGRTARALQDKGAGFLFVADSIFNGDAGHSVAVAQAMHRAGLTIPWAAFFAPLAPPDGYYQTLRECGCSHVEFGTDSLSKAMLQSYRKTFTVEDVQAAHRAAKEAGLYVSHYFLLGGPGESAETIEETLLAAEELSGGVFFFFCGVRIYPGTGLYRQALLERQIAPGDDLLAPVFYRPKAIDLAGVAERIRKRANGRRTWVLHAGGEAMAKVLTRLYARGHKGPLWEWLLR